MSQLSRAEWIDMGCDHARKSGASVYLLEHPNAGFSLREYKPTGTNIRAIEIHPDGTTRELDGPPPSPGERERDLPTLNHVIRRREWVQENRAR